MTGELGEKIDYEELADRHVDAVGQNGIILTVGPYKIGWSGDKIKGDIFSKENSRKGEIFDSSAFTKH